MQITLDFIPLPLLPILIIALLFISLRIGYRIGQRHKVKPEILKNSGVGTSMGALLGLLAFMLAFTFGMAGSRFETRNTVVLEEANDLGTAYLRADYLTEPSRSEIHHLLEQYIDLRVEAAQHLNVNYVLTRSNELLNQLWTKTVAAVQSQPNSAMIALFVQSINEIINVHAKRVKAILGSRIPFVIWVILFALAALTFGALGHISGIGSERNAFMNGCLIIGFALVIYLIADIDRPIEGKVHISQQSILDLHQKINHIENPKEANNEISK
jgi:hypothetical protein